eukprot:15325048-Ditylum_brightwellii.AAC.1
MKPADVTLTEHVVNVEVTKVAATEIANILDAKYQKKHKKLFDGTLGTWKNFQYDIKLQEGVKPYHSRLYTVPKVYKATLHMEVDCLCKIGVLQKVNGLEWGAPTFVVPKKDKTISKKFEHTLTIYC